MSSVACVRKCNYKNNEARMSQIFRCSTLNVAFCWGEHDEHGHHDGLNALLPEACALALARTAGAELGPESRSVGCTSDLAGRQCKRSSPPKYPK